MNKSKLVTISLVMAMALGIHGWSSANTIDPIKTINKVNAVTAVNNAKTYQEVAPLNIVANPKFYLGKNVKFKAKFDKFATLGLDYKPAFRSSEKYISFLIQRDDVKNHNVPLSELKIFLDRTEAEKHIDLNSGDVIEVSGRIFSTALGDAWMDAEKFVVVSSTPKQAK